MRSAASSPVCRQIVLREPKRVSRSTVSAWYASCSSWLTFEMSSYSSGGAACQGSTEMRCAPRQCLKEDLGELAALDADLGAASEQAAAIQQEGNLRAERQHRPLAAIGRPKERDET